MTGRVATDIRVILIVQQAEALTVSQISIWWNVISLFLLQNGSCKAKMPKQKIID